jgi:DNA-binding MarR family transcriptional regulator
MQIEENTASAPIERLAELAEFRFQLRSFLSFSETVSEAAGIQAQQYQLMQVIEAAGEQKASISYLAERMILRHNSTVELVDRAERAGLVERRSDESDLRRSLVSLTAQGRVTLAKLVPQHITELRKRAQSLIDALTSMTSSTPETGEAP